MKRTILFALSIFIRIVHVGAQGGFGPKQDISTSLTNGSSVFAADLDGDGDMDVLGSATGGTDHVAWYENTDGAGTFGSQQIITTAVNDPRSVYAADLDGDGDMDVLSASDHDNKIAWYENTDGAGTFGSQQVLNTSANSATCVHAADLDGDGDMDVLSVSAGDNSVSWYENTDGGGSFSEEIIITTSINSVISVYAADLDGDKDMDIVIAGGTSDLIAWCENTDGAGTFGAYHTISTATDNARLVIPADIDRDGDLDLVSASFDDNKIAWYENTDGKGTFGPQYLISSSTNWAIDVDVCDVDSDGDMDVLTVSSADYKLSWHENLNGKGSFGPEQIIIEPLGGLYSVCHADIDGHLDMDVLTISENKISWFENQIFGSARTLVQNRCQGMSMGRIDLTVVNGASPYTYAWGNGDTTTYISGLAEGDYTVSITDDTSAVFIDTIAIEYPLAIDVYEENKTDVPLCYGDSTGTIEISASGGTGMLVYSIGHSQNDSGKFSTLPAQSYTITVTDDSACSALSSSISVTEPPEIEIYTATASDISCHGYADGHLQISASGGQGQLTYAQGDSSNVTGGFASLREDYYYVTVTDTNGCKKMSSKLSISEPSPVNANAGPDKLVCSGSELTLTGSGGETYQWSGGIAQGVAFHPASTQTYTLTVTDAYGCIGCDTLQVTVKPLPEVSLSADNDTIDLGKAIVLNASGALEYIWSDGTASGASRAVLPTASATYTVTGTDSYACAATDSVAILVIDHTNLRETYGRSMSIYPNPVTVNGTININTDKEIEVLTVYNVRGEILFREENPSFPFMLNGLKSGGYLVHLETAMAQQQKEL